MARYDVYRSQGGVGYLLDVQADYLRDLNTRIVVPLLPPNQAPKPGRRLNPHFKIELEDHVMVTQYLSAVADTELDAPIANLSGHHDDITAALDMLFQGF